MGLGLIPAYAGKTPLINKSIDYSQAHPRVCGENDSNQNPRKTVRGSSPRMRGKRTPFGVVGSGAGLIPAYAGKTNPRNAALVASEAHPRVCGENAGMHLVVTASEGSSPRMRGKRENMLCEHRCARLIPAYAGKTLRTRESPLELGAHPRVCGENTFLDSRCSA